MTLLDAQPSEFEDCRQGQVRVPTLAGENYARPMWREPVATDNSGTVVVSASHVPGEIMLLLGPTDPPVRVTYTEADAFANTATCSFDVVVVDEEPPQITVRQAMVAVLPSTPRAMRAVVVAAKLAPVSIMTDNSGEDVELLAPLTD